MFVNIKQTFNFVAQNAETKLSYDMTNFMFVCCIFVQLTTVPVVFMSTFVAITVESID